MAKDLKSSDSLKISNIPLKGSLGLLAFGDLAFEQWRQEKKKNNIYKSNYEEGNAQK